MIRVLSIVAVAGFLVSAVTLSIAVALTGPQAIMNGAWSFDEGGWGWHDHHHYHHSDHADRWGSAGPDQTREIAWSGDDRLEIAVPAEVQYTQVAGPAKLTVTGPAASLDQLRMDGGRIAYTDDEDHPGRLRIVVSAPSVKDFEIQSSATLTIAGYKQDHLSISIPGDGDVKASGEANEGQVQISGSGRADLGDLRTRIARVDISGSGEAEIAPTDTAEINISGSGDTVLKTDPPHLKTHVSGSGEVRHGG